jgi:ATP-dependent RNA helicase DeaD
MGADNVEHIYYVVKAPDRYLALKRLADINTNIYGIVFCRTRHETKDVAAKLMNDGYSADAIHGDLSQAQRDTVMQRFRKKQLQILVATDVAARGIDITDLTHVLNYNLPDDPEIYIHRSGRTGRAGKHGISISITHSREGRRINELEKLVGKKFKQESLPSGKQICEKRLYSLMDKIEKVEVNEDEIEPFMPAINEKLAWLDRDELLKRFVTVEFQRFLEYYKNAKDINISSDRSEYKGLTKSAKGFSRFFINLGIKHRLRVPEIIGLINDETGTKDIEIGKIEILRNFSFFEVDKEFEQLILDSFKESRHSGVKLTVQLAKPSDSGASNDRKKWTKRKDNRKDSRKRYHDRDR